MFRFIIRTSLAAIVLTYSLNWLYFVRNHGDKDVTKTDCSLYANGKGLNKNGDPFKVSNAIYHTFKQFRD